MGEAKKRKAEIAATIELAHKNIQKLVEEFEAIGFKWKFEGSKEDKKKHGSFYTPPELAAKMSTKFGRYNVVKSTLDPCCGYGGLLLMKMLYDVRILGLDPTLVFINTYGNDSVRSSLKICKDNFMKFAKYFNIPKIAVDFVIESHFSCEDALTSKAYNQKAAAIMWAGKHQVPVIFVDGIFYI